MTSCPVTKATRERLRLVTNLTAWSERHLVDPGAAATAKRFGEVPYTEALRLSLATGAGSGPAKCGPRVA